MIIYTTQRVKSSLDGSEHQQIGVCYPLGLLICFMRVNGFYKEFLLNRAGKNGLEDGKLPMLLFFKYSLLTTMYSTVYRIYM